MSGRWYSYGQGTKVEIFEMNCMEEAADLIFEASHRWRINELVWLYEMITSGQNMKVHAKTNKRRKNVNYTSP